MNSEIVNVDEIEEIIIAYANGELSRRLEVSEDRNDRDTIIAGINMLGEELEKTTISRDFFMNIYNSVSEALIYTDTNGKIIDFNFATEKLFNQERDEIIGKDINQFISNRHHNLILNTIELLNYSSLNSPLEASITLVDDLEVPVLVTISKISDKLNVHKGYLFIATDITEQKNKEINELRIAISAQEKERKRLANDIHDSLGQEINAIKMYVNALAIMDSKSEDYLNAFETCKTILDSALDTIRNISFDLMPKALENGGLLQAIDELVKRLQIVTTIEYNAPQHKIHLIKECQINVYRIIQEFINNSFKHAPNSAIQLRIVKNGDFINIVISDNGKGFEMDSVKIGNGIFNIKNRLLALNATYKFESIIGKGTTLEFRINEQQS